MSEFVMSDFLSMGGYAAYIWPAYGLTGLVLGGLLGNSLWSGWMTRRHLRAIEQTGKQDRQNKPVQEGLEP